MPGWIEASLIYAAVLAVITVTVCCAIAMGVDLEDVD